MIVEAAMDMQVPVEMASAHPALARIADALGLSPGAVFDPDLQVDGDAFAEMIRLWRDMDCCDSRQAMLNVARVLVATWRV